MNCWDLMKEVGWELCLGSHWGLHLDLPWVGCWVEHLGWSLVIHWANQRDDSSGQNWGWSWECHLGILLEED